MNRSDKTTLISASPRTSPELFRAVLAFAALTAAFGLFFSCGTEIGNPKKPKDGAKPSMLVDDPSVVSGIIASQTDEVIAAVAEDRKAGAALGLGLTGPVVIDGLSSGPAPATVPDPTNATATVTCALDSSGAAVLERKVNGADNHSFTRHGVESTYVANLEETTTRTWKLAGAVACNDQKDDVVVDWAKADGLDVSTTVSQNKSMSITRASPRGTMTRSSSIVLSGERHALWAVVADSGDASVLALKKTVTGALDKSFTASRRQGGDVTVSTHIQTKDDQPLVVEVRRDRASQAWQSKTILSGMVVTTPSEDSRMESTYLNVKFSSASGCMPDSGTVSGQIFHGTEATPFRTYQIDFDAGDGTITFDDGTTADYVPEYCSLDDG